jgi:DNA-binding transcriptional LysR family regulator
MVNFDKPFSKNGKPKMTDPNWDDSRVFLALARTGTLSGAARLLKTGVATISRRIDRLERALGLPLFLRAQTGYILTDQGEAMVTRAEAVELAMVEMRHQAGNQSEIRGLVRLASIEALVVPFIVPALAPLLAANPGLDVDIQFSIPAVDMQRHDADLALRIVRPERGNLRVRQLGNMGLGLYGPPDGSRPRRMVSWGDGVGVNILLRWTEAFAETSAPGLAVNTLPGQVEAVRRGIGACVLPHFLAREAGLRLIADRLPNGDLMQREILLVTHTDLGASRRVVSVAEAIADEIVSRRRELAEA